MSDDQERFEYPIDGVYGFLVFPVPSPPTREWLTLGHVTFASGRTERALLRANGTKITGSVLISLHRLRRAVLYTHDSESVSDLLNLRLPTPLIRQLPIGDDPCMLCGYEPEPPHSICDLCAAETEEGMQK